MNDGDLISRKALIEFARNHKDCMVDANDIARFPAVDAVCVVRCKDCKYLNLSEESCEYCGDYYEECGACTWFGACVNLDGFCYHSERRSE